MKSSMRWLVLAVLSSALFLIFIDVTVLYLALPNLAHDLHASASDKLWVVNAYTLIMAGLLPGMGALGDRYGFRRLFITGLMVFGVASLGAAFSQSAPMLIAARVLLAVGAAMMMPATLALIRLVFDDPKERAVAIGIWGSVAAGGAASGPVVGGFLLEYYWWGSVFLINVPVVLLAIVAAVAWLPSSRGNPDRLFDLLASAQIMVALIGLIYAIKEVSKFQTSWPLAAASAIVGLAAGALFVKRQVRSTHPMIDFSLFRDGTFTSGVIASIVASAALVALQLAVSQRLQLVTGLSPLEAGLLILPIPLAAFISGPLSGWILPRVGIDRVLWMSLTVTALGFLGYLLWHEQGVLIQLLASTVIGAGMGAAFTAASSAMLLNVSADKAGMVASIEEVSYELGAALGVSILGSLMAAVYSSAFNPPSGIHIPSVARDSIDGAISVAGALSNDAASSLLLAAYNAFDGGFTLVMALSVAMLLLTSVGIAALVYPSRRLSQASRY